MAKPIVGPVICTINSERYSITGDFEISLTNVSGDGLTTADGLFHPKTIPDAPHITVTAVVDDTFNIEKFVDVDISISLSCASGVYSMTEARLQETPVLTGGEGTVTLTFKGGTIHKIA